MKELLQNMIYICKDVMIFTMYPDSQGMMVTRWSDSMWLSGLNEVTWWSKQVTQWSKTMYPDNKGKNGDSVV